MVHDGLQNSARAYHSPPCLFHSTFATFLSSDIPSKLLLHDLHCYCPSSWISPPSDSCWLAGWLCQTIQIFAQISISLSVKPSIITLLKCSPNLFSGILYTTLIALSVYILISRTFFCMFLIIIT